MEAASLGSSTCHVKRRRQLKSQLPFNSSSSFQHIPGSEWSASDHSFQEDKEGNFQQRQALIVLWFDSVEYLNLKSSHFWTKLLRSPIGTSSIPTTPRQSKDKVWRTPECPLWTHSLALLPDRFWSNGAESRDLLQKWWWFWCWVDDPESIDVTMRWVMMMMMVGDGG